MASNKGGMSQIPWNIPWELRGWDRELGIGMGLCWQLRLLLTELSHAASHPSGTAGAGSSPLPCVLAAGCGVLLQPRALQRAVAAASELPALGGHFPLHPHLWNVLCLPVVSTCPSQPWQLFLQGVCGRARGQEDLQGTDTICFGGLFSSEYFTARRSSASHSLVTLLLPRPFCCSISPGNSCNGAT